MAECPDCNRLREECALAFAEYQSCKDDFAVTRKKDKEFAARKRALERAQGKLSENVGPERRTTAMNAMAGTVYRPKMK